MTLAVGVLNIQACTKESRKQRRLSQAKKGSQTTRRTQREEENKGNSNGTVSNREEFRHHVKKSGILELIERSLEQRCKEEAEGDQGP